MKLPGWFTIDTPLGRYNPDWAIGWATDQGWPHVVCETKSTHVELVRRNLENTKIDCAMKHFKAIGANYLVATDFDDLIARMVSLTEG